MKDFRNKNFAKLKEYYHLYIKHSSLVPSEIIKEFIDKNFILDSDKRIFFDIIREDGMTSFLWEEVYEVATPDKYKEKNDYISEIENAIIDDIVISIPKDLIESNYAKYRKRLTINDEEKLFDFLANKVRENEDEYVTIPELINVMLASLPYAKTQEAQDFIRIFVDMLEENF